MIYMAICRVAFSLHLFPVVTAWRQHSSLVNIKIYLIIFSCFIFFISSLVGFPFFYISWFTVSFFYCFLFLYHLHPFHYFLLCVVNIRRIVACVVQGLRVCSVCCSLFLSFTLVSNTDHRLLHIHSRFIIKFFFLSKSFFILSFHVKFKGSSIIGNFSTLMWMELFFIRLIQIMCFCFINLSYSVA